MNNLLLHGCLAAKMAFHRFIYGEKGDTNIVSIVVLIGIVIMLAAIFRTQISSLVESLLGNIVNQANVVGSPTK